MNPKSQISRFLAQIQTTLKKQLSFLHSKILIYHITHARAKNKTNARAKNKTNLELEEYFTFPGEARSSAILTKGDINSKKATGEQKHWSVVENQSLVNKNLSTQILKRRLKEFVPQKNLEGWRIHGHGFCCSCKRFRKLDLVYLWKDDGTEER